GGLRKQIRLTQQELLAVAVQQVEELRLQRRAGAPVVEVGEERVLGLFENGDGVEARSDAAGQRGLADANRAFNRDRPEREGVNGLQVSWSTHAIIRALRPSH